MAGASLFSALGAGFSVVAAGASLVVAPLVSGRLSAVFVVVGVLSTARLAAALGESGAGSGFLNRGFCGFSPACSRFSSVALFFISDGAGFASVVVLAATVSLAVAAGRSLLLSDRKSVV